MLKEKLHFGELRNMNASRGSVIPNYKPTKFRKAFFLIRLLKRKRDSSSVYNFFSIRVLDSYVIFVGE